jgi:hypothetical protein
VFVGSLHRTGVLPGGSGLAAANTPPDRGYPAACELPSTLSWSPTLAWLPLAPQHALALPNLCAKVVGPYSYRQGGHAGGRAIRGRGVPRGRRVALSAELAELPKELLLYCLLWIEPPASYRHRLWRPGWARRRT